MRKLAIDLFCGLGGWSEGLLAEGWDVVGFDIERHDYGTGGYPGQLVLQDALTLHGSQFRNASLIVASPPCQRYSYMAMPFSRGRRIAQEYCDGTRSVADLNALFDACFRIQREASEAAGRHIPLIVENVKGAQPWVGRAKAHYGSFYLWGDVDSVGNAVVVRNQLLRASRKTKGRSNFHFFEKTGLPSPSFHGAEHEDSVQRYQAINGRKGDGGGWFGDYQAQKAAQDGIKQGGEWWHDPGSMTRRYSSKSAARKAASAQIAKIPLELARYIARVFAEPGSTENTLDTGAQPGVCG